MALLTKSKYMIGLQCPMYLWLAVNDKNSLPEPDEAALRVMEQGTEIGKLATQLFPKGIDLSTAGFMENISLTKEALKKKKTIFEAGILFNDCYSRADILVPVGDKWDIYEVKGTTSVKPEHIQDVAFQKHVYGGAGLKVRQCYVVYLNKEYIKKGKLDVKSLFTKDNITNEVKEEIKGIQDRIDKMFKIVNDKKPKHSIHYRCNKPYDCPLMKDCWDFLPDENVFDLSRGGIKSFDMFDSGITCIKDITGDFKLTDKQNIQKDCAVNRCVRIHKQNIKNFLKRLKYPLYHLDFETFQSGLPIFDGTRCWQQIPFQFSLHIEQEDGTLEHHSFIAKSKGDPRKSFAKELKKVLGSKGDIVVYNQSFEKMIMTQLGEFLPEYKDWVDDCLTRFVDLLDVFKKFDYYNPKQKGSASIKKVLPALVGKDAYNGLDIHKGDQASLAFVKLREGVGNEKKIRKDLEVYCGLDTEAMVWIIQELRKLVK